MCYKIIQNSLIFQRKMAAFSDIPVKTAISLSIFLSFIHHEENKTDLPLCDAGNASADKHS